MTDLRKLLIEAREFILSHVDLNTCYPHERRVISDIDAALAEKVEPVAWRFRVDGQWFTGATREACHKAMVGAGVDAEIQPLYAAPADQWRRVEDVVDAREVRVAYEYMRDCNFPDIAACRVIESLYRQITKPALPEADK